MAYLLKSSTRINWIGLLWPIYQWRLGDWALVLDFSQLLVGGNLIRELGLGLDRFLSKLVNIIIILERFWPRWIDRFQHLETKIPNYTIYEEFHISIMVSRCKIFEILSFQICYLKVSTQNDLLSLSAKTPCQKKKRQIASLWRLFWVDTLR